MHLFGIKKDVDLFINITLNLQISLGETDAFVMLRSYIKSKWFFLHVKVQFWTFSSNLKFNYIDLHIFTKFTPSIYMVSIFMLISLIHLKFIFRYGAKHGLIFFLNRTLLIHYCFLNFIFTQWHKVPLFKYNLSKESIFRSCVLIANLFLW